MNNEIIFEFRLFCAFFLLGFIVLLTYDIFCVIKRAFGRLRVPATILEVLFWIGCALIVFLLSDKMNYGVVRGFALVAGAAGMYTYKRSLGRLYPEHTYRHRKRRRKRSETEGTMGRKKKHNRAGLRLIAVMVLAICGVLVCATINVKKEYDEQAKKKDQILSQIKDEEEKNEELKEYSLYMKTKKYVEDIAREILGLVYPDEIVIEPEE